jgi:hypothetical protein
MQRRISLRHHPPTLAYVERRRAEGKTGTAEQYQCVLVTTDARLARASGVRCTVSVIS